MSKTKPGGVKPAPGARVAFEYRLPGAISKVGAVNRPRGEVAHELLTHVVQGQYASDLEERFARGLERNGRVLRYDFQPSFLAGRNLPGEVRPDFVIFAPAPPQPVQVDGEFAHKTAEQHATDAIKDAILDEALKGSGALPTVRVPGDQLQDAAAVDQVLRRLLV